MENKVNRYNGLGMERRVEIVDALIREVEELTLMEILTRISRIKSVRDSNTGQARGEANAQIAGLESEIEYRDLRLISEHRINSIHFRRWQGAESFQG